jgi:LuxR family maltose regulon positive regulatory protein
MPIIVDLLDRETLKNDIADQRVSHHPSFPRQEPAKSIMLVSKEQEVLELLAAGVPNKLIAETLMVSSETIKWRLKNIFNKFDVHDRYHVVLRARELGIG